MYDVMNDVISDVLSDVMNDVMYDVIECNECQHDKEGETAMVEEGARGLVSRGRWSCRERGRQGKRARDGSAGIAERSQERQKAREIEKPSERVLRGRRTMKSNRDGEQESRHQRVEY